MRAVGALEVTSRFEQLLDAVEHGEEIAITRDGREVARLVPAPAAPAQAAARVAMQRLRTRAAAGNFGRFDWNEWKTFRDDGRR